jgi:membrane protease YdiL (CAAX protease family)
VTDGRSPPLRPELATQALVVTAALYLGYAALGAVGLSNDLRYLGLVAGFYLLPGYLLRRDPERAREWQVGPDGVIPRWSWRGAKWAAILALLVFPPFVLGFLWFYAKVCNGDLGVLSPVLWIEGLTPAAGGLERYLDRFCRAYGGDFWPSSLRVPEAWLLYGGAGVLLEVAKELFTIALPEEVFHRGYLMSALEQRWPARRRILGAPLGLAALLACLIFAVGHLVGELALARLATFFPSLVFSWLWRRSGSLWAPALFHAASNLLMSVLLASTFGR